MAVHIRLARAGTKKTPFYRIIVADQRSPRGGRFIERLGTYDPRRTEVRLNKARTSLWISKGAQPSHTVSLLLRRTDVVDMVVTPGQAPSAPTDARSQNAAEPARGKRDASDKK